MMKNCIICGKPFEAKQQNYKLCSDACRQAREIEWRKEHKRDYKTDERRRQSMEYYRKRAKTVLCKICGKPVPPVNYGGRIHRKHMHEECVVNEAIQLVKDGTPSTDVRLLRAYNRAYSMGYTVRELKEILREEYYDD